MDNTCRKRPDACRRMADALAGMLKRTSIENIVIKDLCLAANVNRSTFYRYYADQYALLYQVWCDLTQTYLDTVYQPHLNDLEALVLLLHFARDNRTIVLAVFQLVVLGHPLPDYADFVRITLVDRCPKEKKPYLQASLVSMIYSWLIKKNPEPADFIARLMIDVAESMM